MKKKMISLLLGVSMVTMLMSGCSGPKEATTTTTPAASPEAASPAAPAESAKTPEAPASTTPASAEATTGKKERPAGGFKLGYTCMDGTNPFFVTLEKSIKAEVEKNGDTLISSDPANNVQTQITQVEDMIAQGIDAIFLNPVDAQGIRPALDLLKEANIPIINFDAEVADMDYLVSYIGSDNYNAGFVCGEDLVKKIPAGGKILVLDSPTMQSVVDRTNGFLKAIEGKGFTIVGQQDAKGNLQVAMEKSEDLLQANGDVVAIFGGNDPTALGALAAANSAGIKECKIYGVDGSPDIKKEIASGTSLIEGSGAQSPVTIGKTSVEVLYKYFSGEKIEARYPVPTFLITSENVEKYGTTDWQ